MSGLPNDVKTCLKAMGPTDERGATSIGKGMNPERDFWQLGSGGMRFEEETVREMFRLGFLRLTGNGGEDYMVADLRPEGLAVSKALLDGTWVDAPEPPVELVPAVMRPLPATPSPLIPAAGRAFGSLFNRDSKDKYRPTEETYGNRPIVIHLEDIIGAASRLADVAERPERYTPQQWCQAVEAYLRSTINALLLAPEEWIENTVVLKSNFSVPALCEVDLCQANRMPGSRFCQGHALLAGDAGWTAEPMRKFTYRIPV